MTPQGFFFIMPPYVFRPFLWFTNDCPGMGGSDFDLTNRA